MKKSLEGLKVLDLSRVLAGPYCTMLMADLGAEIIKVEQPGVGDDSRAFAPFIGKESAYFMSLNRGKKSICLNLKKGEDREVFWGLVKCCDILVENYRPGTMEKLGLGYEEIKKVNPRLIYAAISGFGHTGPYSQFPAYDMIVQAMGGVMSITGEEGRPPVRVGTSIGDITAALFGTIGILTALNVRHLTGQGQKVDVSMLDSQVAILENAITRYETSGQVPTPLGTRHPSIAPFQAFPTKDYYVIVAVGNDSLWGKFCRCLDLEHLLIDPRFKSNQDRIGHVEELDKIISKITLTKTTDEWLEVIKAAGIPAAAINTIDKVVNDPQVLARNMLVELEHPVAGKMKVPGNPIKLSLTPPVIEEPAPLLGEHTKRVLQEILGWEEEKSSRFGQE